MLCPTHAGWHPFAGTTIAGNPLSLGRRRRGPAKPRVARYLTHALWDAVKEAIEAMPDSTDRERRHAARFRWLCTVLYLGGLRGAEVLDTSMGAFFCRATPRASSAGGWR